MKRVLLFEETDAMTESDVEMLRMSRAASDPAFRSWSNSLRIPNGFDRDTLLAAGVIADDADWLRWCDKGWLDYAITATDAQAVALFGLVQAQLARRVAA